MNWTQGDWKVDDRPKMGGWAKGNYLCKCHSCKQAYMGDKRSIVCADCAYKEQTND